MILQFDKIVNSRELGGIKVQDGRHVKQNRLFRTAHLGEASDNDLQRIKDYGIREIVDFRSVYETGRMPDRKVDGIWHVQIEVLSLNAHLYKGMAKCFEKSGSFEVGMSEFVMTPAAEMLCDGFYISFVDDPDSQAAYARFFRELLSLKGAPVLWHCTQGKDRTGLGAAFLLYALGADRKTILEDFALTNVSYAQDMEYVKSKVIGLGGGPLQCSFVDTLVGVSVQSFIDSLDWIDNNYGGMESYLANQLELGAEDREKLKSWYLE